MFKIYTLLFILVFSHICLSQATVNRGPYLQMANTKSMMIKWQTSIATGTSIYIGKTLESKKKVFSNNDLSINHQVNISALEPATTYYYSLGTDNEIIDNNINNKFTTNPIVGTEQKTTIWATGDCGTGAPTQTKVLQQIEKQYADKNLNLWLLLGDNAYSLGSQNEYQANFFGPYQGSKIMKQVPIFPTPGNHDYAQFSGKAKTDVPYFQIFNLPFNGEIDGTPSITAGYYSYNYANIHFVSLDSYGIDYSKYRLYDKDGPQIEWLEADLAKNKQKWTIVYFHHPPYTMGSHNSDTEDELLKIRESLVPIFDKYNVDLVLTGHSHNYERSGLLHGHTGLENSFNPNIHLKSKSSGKYNNSLNSCAFVKNYNDKNQGTIYAVAGSAGFPGGKQASYPHDAMAHSFSEVGGSLIVEVEGDRLDAKFITEDGGIEDTFTIFKQYKNKQDLTILPNQNITLTANWAGNYVWNDAKKSTEKEIVARYNESKKVLVTDSKNCISNTFNINVKPCEAGTYTIPFADGTVKIATLECTGSDGFTHYSDENGNILISINKKGNEIGNVFDKSLKIEIGGENETEQINGNFPENFITNEAGWRKLKNYWLVESTKLATTKPNLSIIQYIPKTSFEKLVNDNGEPTQISKKLEMAFLKNPEKKQIENTIKPALKYGNNGAWMYTSKEKESFKHFVIEEVNSKYLTLKYSTNHFGLSQVGMSKNSEKGYGYKLINFDGELVDHKVSLSWKAVNEENLSNFELLKLTEGNSEFVKINDVTPKINTDSLVSINAYNFVETANLYGQNQYKIRYSFDLDGVKKTKESKIISLKTDLLPSEESILENITASPNPSTDGSFYFNKSINVDNFEINSSSGIKILEGNNLKLDKIQLKNVPAGSYYMKIKKGESYKTLKLMYLLK